MLHILSKSSRAPVVGILPTPAPPRWGGESIKTTRRGVELVVYVRGGEAKRRRIMRGAELLVRRLLTYHPHHFAPHKSALSDLQAATQ